MGGSHGASAAAQQEADDAEARMKQEEQEEAAKNTEVMNEQLEQLRRFRGGGFGSNSGSNSTLGGN